MNGVRTKKGGGFDWLSLLQKGLFVLGIILVLPFIWKYVRNFLQSEMDAEADDIADNPQRLKSAMDLAYEDYDPLNGGAERYQNAAKIIFEAFNIPRYWYSWLNPGNWFEDDDKAFQTLMATTGGIRGAEQEYLSICYMLISGSQRRDLTRDIGKYLNEDRYQQFLTYL